MADAPLHPEVEAVLQLVASAHGGPDVRWANNEDLRHFALLAAEKAREEADRMKAATYSHVDGRDLLHELQPNGAHHIDILVRINGQDRRYEGDWLKRLTHARDGHNMGEYADNPQLRALIEQRRKDGSPEGGAGSAAILAEKEKGKC